MAAPAPIPYPSVQPPVSGLPDLSKAVFRINPSSGKPEGDLVFDTTVEKVRELYNQLKGLAIFPPHTADIQEKGGGKVSILLTSTSKEEHPDQNPFSVRVVQGLANIGYQIALMNSRGT